MIFTRRKADEALNEFSQNIKPISLYRDAWKRLRKNKMALAGIAVVLFYFAVSLLAPVLPLYPYERQEMRTYICPRRLKAPVS